MKVVLLGNYKPDKQESMDRFALMLQSGLASLGIEAEIWRPEIITARRVASTTKGLGKWLGYVDKWLLFPLILKSKLKKNLRENNEVCFHICDHSNAPYLAYLPAQKTSITCHDVLAIRGALGYKDAYCSASWLGVLLQKWILKHLEKAERVAAVSSFTLDQLIGLTGKKNIHRQSWKVIHNGFNADFKKLGRDVVVKRLVDAGLNAEASFILHVGSSLERKNRKLLLQMAAALGDKWKGYILFAGKAIDKTLMQQATQLGLQERVVSVLNPDHDTLEALYNACEAFIFPSLSEGFGWPVIEAQACGTPVIASNLEPMPEVSGGAALHADPLSPEAFANAFLSLRVPAIKEELINRGYRNADRFNPVMMIEEYIALIKTAYVERTANIS